MHPDCQFAFGNLLSARKKMCVSVPENVKLGSFSLHFLFWDLKFYFLPCFVLPHTRSTTTGVFKRINNSTSRASNALPNKKQSWIESFLFFMLKMFLQWAIVEMRRIFSNKINLKSPSRFSLNLFEVKGKFFKIQYGFDRTKVKT